MDEQEFRDIVLSFESVPQKKNISNLEVFDGKFLFEDYVGIEETQDSITDVTSREEVRNIADDRFEPYHELANFEAVSVSEVEEDNKFWCKVVVTPQHLDSKEGAGIAEAVANALIEAHQR